MTKQQSLAIKKLEDNLSNVKYALDFYRKSYKSCRHKFLRENLMDCNIEPLQACYRVLSLELEKVQIEAGLIEPRRKI